jgi:simple sugar transport system ATP-binding protein
LRGVTKNYGAVVACRDVDLRVARGEIHGLLGENGAGKTTLMKVLIGLTPLDAGEIRINGKPTVVRDPVHAASLGLAMAQQHFSLIERLRVWENVSLAHRGRLTKRGAIAAVSEIGARYGLESSPHARVEDLTVGQRQRVEVIKCLSLDPAVLILDEPTSVLSVDESRELFRILRQVVTTENRAVILISHKLDEVLGATDRVTIMRDGVAVETLMTADADAHHLARSMVGRDVLLQAEMAAVGLLEGSAASPLADPPAARTAVSGPAGAIPAPDPSEARQATTALHIDDVEVLDAGGRPLLDGFSVTVGRGEIVGIAGVEGNGQSTLGDLLSGLVSPARGTIDVGGVRVAATAPRELLRAGVGVIPEDRHASGCILEMSVADNLVAADLDHYTRGRVLLDRRAILERARRLIDEYDIAAPSPLTSMASLSGGSQQRVVVARELSRNPTVLIAVQPTRGLDVGAVEYMSERLRQAAADGVGILLVSTDLEEILAIADRIVVMHAGRNMGEMGRGEVGVERLGLLIGGHGS